MTSAIMALCDQRSASAAPSAAAERGRPKKHNSEDTNETGRRQRRREREQPADRGHQKLQPPMRQPRTEQDGLKEQPFGGKSIERRQRRNRRTGNEERETRDRHEVNEAAKTFHAALARRGRTTPAPKNKTLLKSA